jgi:hypothetical protein
VTLKCAMGSFDGELTPDTNDGQTSRTIQIIAVRIITPNQAKSMNKTLSCCGS